MGAILDTTYNQIPSRDNRSTVISMTSLQSLHNSAFNKKYSDFKQLVLNNEIDKIASLDKNILENVLNHVDEELKKPILLLACEDKDSFKSITPQTINLLIEKGAQIDYIDTSYYGWEALHYAALAANPTKLRIISEKLGKDRINTLTTLSENALHILLDHGTFAESFNISCQNGVDLKMSKIIGREKDDVVNCVKILIEAGIDVNHSNFWNETPLLIAIKRKYFRIVQLLLEVKNIDLDSSRGAVSRKTARELLKGKEAYFGLLPKQRSCTDQGKILFRLLKSGDEEAFLKFNGGKIRELANAMDGDNEMNSSCTLLQYCFRRGLISWYRDKKKHDYESQFHYSDITANYLVQVFCKSGMARAIQHLLDNGARTDINLKKFSKSLLEVAAIKGYYPLVCLILGREDFDFSSDHICDVIETLMTTADGTIDLDSTLTVLLNRLLITGDPSKDKLSKLMEVLKRGVRRINKENIKLLLKFPGSLSTIKDNKPILEEIDPEVIQTHLDDCVEQKNGAIHITYTSFLKDESTNQVLQNFLSSPVLHTFLNHLVFKIMIHRKWEQLHWYYGRKYFYLNFYFYILFCIVLNVYVMLKFNNASSEIIDSFFYVGVICLVLFILKEIAQILADWRLYIKEFNNWTELFLIGVTIWVYSAPNNTSMVLAVLGSNVVLLLFLEQVPKCTRYIIILRTVVFYLKYLIFYFIQFLAFAICFYILFSKPDQKFYIDLPNKIFETIILFTGNLEYMKTDDFAKNELFSKIIFILFVVFMAIILHNLLLGLLVTDMSNSSSKVKMYEQMKRANFVVRLEMLFISKIMQWLPQWLLNYNQNSNIFDDTNFTIIVDDRDRNMLDDNEKQHLDFILVKKVKRQNVLKKLYSYIKTKVNECTPEGTPSDINKELLQKLQLIEERIKNLHDTNELIKAEINKNNVK